MENMKVEFTCFPQLTQMVWGAEAIKDVPEGWTLTGRASAATFQSISFNRSEEEEASIILTNFVQPKKL